jgi:hypothetical protein
VANELATSCRPCDRNFYKGSDLDVVCKPCPVGTFSSLLRDACLTLAFDQPPTRVVPNKAFRVEGIAVRSAIGQSTASPYSTVVVFVTLAKRNRLSTPDLSFNVTFNSSTWTSPSVMLPLGLNPASDFIWTLQLIHPDIVSISIPIEDVDVAVLDVAPVVDGFSLADVPFTGGIVSIDCVPSGPSATFFLPLFTVPNVTNASCVFLPTSPGLSPFSQPAHFSHISRTHITLRCGSLSSGQLGPLFSVWNARVVFPDGRESPPSAKSLTVRCPAGMFIQAHETASCVKPPCCQACPSPMSMSYNMDSVGNQSCICQPGYYGLGGTACRACPKNTKYGFNCSVAGLQFPLVKPGFFIDYSQLFKCTEESCSAVLKCPNARACPGVGERNCLNTDDECYSNRSMGCTICCQNYYADNFVCKKCPESKLIVVLAVAIVLLIMASILSSHLTFPPFVAAAKGMKLVLSGLQSFACVRLMAGLSMDNDGVLSGVNWPDVILSVFEFMNTFTFSFDSLRPECTFSFSARTKLILMSVGPFLVSSAILMMAVLYAVLQAYRLHTQISNHGLLSARASKTSGLFRSILYCLAVSTISMKYSRDNQVVYGPLWPALDPALVERSDIAVVSATARQRTTTLIERAQEKKSILRKQQLDKLPEVWKKMIQDFKISGVTKCFSNAAQTMRLLFSSALSVFVFTFQGVMETILSTWDCKNINDRKFLRYRPDIECSSARNELYSHMVFISCTALVLYTVVLPLCVVLVVRSRWSREMYAFNFNTYDQLFGFITSQYTSTYVSWEAVNCLRKMLLVAIPLVLTSSPIIQSIFNILLFAGYSMVILAYKPMVSSFLNTIEVLNSCNIIITSFAAIMFTVQYQNVHVLQGDSRDYVGVLLVVFITSIFLLSIRLIYVEFFRMYALHHNTYLSRWLCAILSRAGSSIRLDQYLPISLLFFNKTSSKAIQDEFDAIDLNRRQTVSRIRTASFAGRFVLVWTKIKLWWNEWSYASNFEVDEDAADRSMAEADNEFFVWMHKLLQRTLAWKSREKELRRSSFYELPKIFTNNFGESDPPIAFCDSLLRTSRAVDEILNEEHKTLLLAFMLQGNRIDIRANLDNGKCAHYEQRMRTLIQSFIERLKAHIHASETFRVLTENEVEKDAFRPFRKLLYGAKQSEEVKVLRRISSTSLKQYCGLHKSVSDEHSVVLNASGLRNRPVVSEKLSTSRSTRRSQTCSPPQNFGDARANRANAYVGVGNCSTQENIVRAQERTCDALFQSQSVVRKGANPSNCLDCVELQELVIESLDSAPRDGAASLETVIPPKHESKQQESEYKKRTSRTIVPLQSSLHKPRSRFTVLDGQNDVAALASNSDLSLAVSSASRGRTNASERKPDSKRQQDVSQSFIESNSKPDVSRASVQPQPSDQSSAFLRPYLHVEQPCSSTDPSASKASDDESSRPAMRARLGSLFEAAYARVHLASTSEADVRSARAMHVAPSNAVSRPGSAHAPSTASTTVDGASQAGNKDVSHGPVQREGNITCNVADLSKGESRSMRKMSVSSRSVAMKPSSTQVPARTPPAVADVVADIGADVVENERLGVVKKVDLRSGRAYFVNLIDKTTSWLPPDGWISHGSSETTGNSSSVEAKSMTQDRGERTPPPPIQEQQLHSMNCRGDKRGKKQLQATSAERSKASASGFFKQSAGDDFPPPPTPPPPFSLVQQTSASRHVSAELKSQKRNKREKTQLQSPSHEAPSDWA